MTHWRTRVVALMLAACVATGCQHDTSTTGTGGTSDPPHPGTTDPAEILENIVAGVRLMRLDRSQQYAALGKGAELLVVGQLLDVKSETKLPDYYLVRLDDRQNRKPRFGVLVSKAGKVMIVSEANDDVGPHPRPALDEIAKRIRDQYGPADVGYVYAYSSIQPGSPLYVPLVRARTKDKALYVNSWSDVFIVESQEPGTLYDSFTPDTRYWVRTTSLFIRLKKVGALSP